MVAQVWTEASTRAVMAPMAARKLAQTLGAAKAMPAASITTGVPMAASVSTGMAMPASAVMTSMPVTAGSVYTGVPQEPVQTGAGYVVPAQPAGTMQGGMMYGYMADAFERMDQNHDGVLQRAEWDAAMQVHVEHVGVASCQAGRCGSERQREALSVPVPRIKSLRPSTSARRLGSGRSQQITVQVVECQPFLLSGALKAGRSRLESGCLGLGCFLKIEADAEAVCCGQLQPKADA